MIIDYSLKVDLFQEVMAFPNPDVNDVIVEYINFGHNNF